MFKVLGRVIQKVPTLTSIVNDLYVEKTEWFVPLKTLV